MKQTIILGNIITVDEKKPFAKASLVKEGVFAYIGGLCMEEHIPDHHSCGNSATHR